MLPSEFPYRTMATDELRAERLADAAEVRRLLDAVAEAVLQLGQRLGRAEGELPQGLFRAWLYSEFQWPVELADAFIGAAVEFSRGSACDCRPQAALDICRSLLPEAFAAQQLLKAKSLLAAYRAVLRLDTSYRELPRALRRPALRELPVWANHSRGRRRRRPTPPSDREPAE